MQDIHFQVIREFVQRIQLASGRNAIDRDEFLRLLAAFAQKQNITKITKLSVLEINVAIKMACLPKIPSISTDLAHLHIT